MLLSPFSSLLDEAETVAPIYKHDTARHSHNHHGRPNHNNDEIVMII